MHSGFFVTISFCVLKVSGQCSIKRGGSCMYPGNVKGCLCSCLQAEHYQMRLLRLDTHRRCYDLLKQCSWTLQSTYTIVNITNGLNEEEIYTSGRVVVPYNKTIIVKIQSLNQPGRYYIKIKPSCTICDDGCIQQRIEGIVIPSQAKIQNSLQMDDERRHTRGSLILLITAPVIGVMAVGGVVLSMVSARNRRQPHHYQQTFTIG